MALACGPLLPQPPSWFPGHMMKFTRMLPALLTRTDVVLEIRDARLPLTSINRTLEGALRKWRAERGWSPHNPLYACLRTLRVNESLSSTKVIKFLSGAWSRSDGLCQLDSRATIYVRVVTQATPHTTTQPESSKYVKTQPINCATSAPMVWYSNHQIASDIAKEYPHNTELNVLVIGMPNVGKSTLLNALRNMGIQGCVLFSPSTDGSLARLATPKAFQTSAQPGLTRALSTRLKLSLEPPVYAFDTPGVMLPYLGQGQTGAERGVKLALIGEWLSCDPKAPDLALHQYSVLTA
ncbi:Mitochondrial GTPase [Salix suchowensis]|nr:Mitochondrial GTPase [Salix suchowensis]